jgi:hypothetical protein
MTDRLGRRFERARPVACALAAFWAWQSAFAALASAPFVSLVGATLGRRPDGDAVLWTPGSRALLAFVLRESHGLQSAAQCAMLVLLVDCVVGLVPLAALMFTLAGGARSLSRAIAKAVRVFPKLVGLLVVFTAGQVLAVGLAFGLFETAAAIGRDTYGDARAAQLGLALATSCLPMLGVVVVAHDVARAAVIDRGAGTWRAVAVAVAAVRRRPVCVWSWAWRAATSLLAIAAGAAFAARVGGRGGAYLLLLGLVHQAAVLARIGLRASWLVQALRVSRV